MSEIEVAYPQQHTSTLADQMDYARAVSTAALLPEAYRGKPADIMLAVGLGQSMGLSPAESLYRIHVIKGKPTAAAELIAANVRKAGHRLRVVGDERTCTATIIRSDDPEFEFKVTRDAAWVQSMGLASNDNYRKQPATMLAWRAITAVARLACPEALYGVAYTADEMEDLGEPRRGGLASVVTPSQEPPPSEPGPTTSESPLLNTSSKLAKAMFASINDLGIADNERIPFIISVIDRHIESSKEMTDDEARLVLAHIDQIIQPADVVGERTDEPEGGE